MKKATISICTGTQPYLYNCMIWCSGKRTCIKENIFFDELIEFLSSLLLNVYQPLALDHVEFASHLLNIAKNEEYSFKVPYDLVEDSQNN